MVASTSFALFLSSFLPLVHGHVAKKPAPHRNASYGDSLVVSEAPDYVRPYILPNLEGKKVQLATDVFRMLVTNASSGGAFSLLGTNGVHGLVVPEHYHSEYYETFFCVKGALNVWVDDQVRRLTAQDFGAVPAFHNHSYQLVEPDSQFTGFISPGGFEALFLNVSAPFNPSVNTPYPPDQALAFPGPLFGAVAKKYDVNLDPTPSLDADAVNGTNPGGVWHTGSNPIPTNDSTPYYVANNYGPKHLNLALGQVVAKRATPQSTGGRFSLSTVVMRKRRANDTIPTYSLPEPYVVQVLEGQLTVRLAGYEDTLAQGDVAFVPGNTGFSYWSEVNFVKFYVGASGSEGLDVELTKPGSGAEEWDYAVLPAYA